MLFHDVEQNTDEWLDLRVGKLTGSNISKVMANYGKAFGDPAKKLAIQIARERVTGRRSLAESYSNAHTERGHEQEPIARALYEEQTFTAVSNGGFFEGDDTGCSPDGLVFTDGLIEIKSVIDSVHYATIKRSGVDPAYKWQCDFNLMETKREWLDFVSYCADFPENTQLYIFRIYKDERAEQFEMMRNRMVEFFKMVDESMELIKGAGRWL